jgi:hypothetical protein
MFETTSKAAADPAIAQERLRCDVRVTKRVVSGKALLTLDRLSLGS